MTQSLRQLENHEAFIDRHIGPDAQQQQEMLEAVGARSLNELIASIVPADIQLAEPPQVGEAATEFAALAELKTIASRNKRFKTYIGMGYTAVQTPRLFCVTCWKTQAGIPHTRRISRKYHKAVLKHCLTSSK